MTTEEIKKMITDTLQGQGNQVDIGGGIPKILNAIVEKIDEGGGGGAAEPIEITIDLFALAAYKTSETDKVTAFDAIPKSVMMKALGVTEDNLTKIMAGNVVLYYGSAFFHCFSRFEDVGLNVSYDSLDEPYLFNSAKGVSVVSLFFTAKEDGTYAFRRGEVLLPYAVEAEE